jgi:glutamate--cysteine ligase
VFPEVRVKRTIEVRGADCVPLSLAGSFVALFRVLLYDDRARARASDLAARFSSHGTQGERFDVACRDGLGGVVGGRLLAQWAADLVDIAEHAADADERLLLAPLVAQVGRGESPAAEVLRAFARSPDPARFLPTVAYRA